METEVDFFGETYTTDGCRPAQSKVSVISEMPPPTCKKQVQSFIGMIDYLLKFLARLLELAEPIRELSKDKVPFNWGLEHHTAFKQIKKEIVRASLYWPTTILRKKQHSKQMQAPKGLLHVCCRTRNQSTL